MAKKKRWRRRREAALRLESPREELSREIDGELRKLDVIMDVVGSIFAFLVWVTFAWLIFVVR